MIARIVPLGLVLSVLAVPVKVANAAAVVAVPVGLLPDRAVDVPKVEDEPVLREVEALVVDVLA